MKTDDLFVRAKLFFFSFRSQRSNENRFDRRRKPEEQRLVSSSSQCFLADLRRNSPTTTTTTSSNVSSADWSSFAGKTFQKRKNIQRDFLFSVRQNESFVSPIVKLLIQRLKPAINDELVRQIGKVYQFNIATLGEFYLDLKNGSFFLLPKQIELICCFSSAEWRSRWLRARLLAKWCSWRDHRSIEPGRSSITFDRRLERTRPGLFEPTDHHRRVSARRSSTEELGRSFAPRKYFSFQFEQLKRIKIIVSIRDRIKSISNKTKTLFSRAELFGRFDFPSLDKMLTNWFGRSKFMVDQLIRTARMVFFPESSLNFALIETNQCETKTQNNEKPWTLPDTSILLTVKHRLTIERRRTRRHSDLPMSLMMKYGSPRQDLKQCFECGHWHEKKTICEVCYDRVRKETAALRDAYPDKDEWNYNHPSKEIVFAYRGDEMPPSENKKVVEIDRERPNWFSTNLRHNEKTNK